MKKTSMGKMERILERLEWYREELKSEGKKKYNILMAERLYVEDVDFLLSQIRKAKKVKKK
jgi:hypothetical protein